MMRLSLIIGALVVISPIAVADIELNVAERTSVEATVLTEQHGGKEPGRWLLEVQNTGSRPVTARFRLAIVQNNTTVEQIHTGRFAVAPGAFAEQAVTSFDPSRNGTVEARLFLMYGDIREIIETYRFTEQAMATEPGFRIRDTAVSYDTLTLDVQVPRDVASMTALAKDATDRTFAQQIIASPRREQTITIPFIPSIDDRQNVSIVMYGDEGDYYHAKEFSVTPGTGKAWYTLFLDVFSTLPAYVGSLL